MASIRPAAVAGMYPGEPLLAAEVARFLGADDARRRARCPCAEQCRTGWPIRAVVARLTRSRRGAAIVRRSFRPAHRVPLRALAPGVDALRRRSAASRSTALRCARWPTCRRSCGAIRRTPSSTRSAPRSCRRCSASSAWCRSRRHGGRRGGRRGSSDCGRGRRWWSPPTCITTRTRRRGASTRQRSRAHAARATDTTTRSLRRHAAERPARPREEATSVRLLAACNSGDTAGGKDSVVGYSSFALYEHSRRSRARSPSPAPPSRKSCRQGRRAVRRAVVERAPGRPSSPC